MVYLLKMELINKKLYCEKMAKTKTVRQHDTLYVAIKKKQALFKEEVDAMLAGIGGNVSIQTDTNAESSTYQRPETRQKKGRRRRR